eukprot:5298272-Pyramimonas_sp.AAC.1
MSKRSGRKDASVVEPASDVLDNFLDDHNQDDKDKKEQRYKRFTERPDWIRLKRALYVVIPVVLYTSYLYLWKLIHPRIAIGICVGCAALVALVCGRGGGVHGVTNMAAPCFHNSGTCRSQAHDSSTVE